MDLKYTFCDICNMYVLLCEFVLPGSVKEALPLLCIICITSVVTEIIRYFTVHLSS